MQVSLKIRQLIFAERGLCLMVQNINDSEYSYYSPADLFFNDDLLSAFNFSDVRLICYFAVVSEYDLDHLFLKKVRRSKSFRKKVWAGPN